MDDRASKKIKIAGAVVALIILALGGWIYYQNSRPPSTQTVSQPDSGSSGQTQGVVDNNQSAATGKLPAATPPPTNSSIKSSPFGIIDLTSPAANATVGSGSAISGSASGLANVQYRIINAAGKVVVSGPLEVINGTFYGTIQSLDPGTATGTVEVFDYKNGDGAAENIITVAVSFQ